MRFVLAAGLWLAVSPAAGAAEPVSCIVVYEVDDPAADGKQRTDIRAQRVSPAGDLLWREGVSLAAIDAGARAPVAVADRAGGALMVFEVHHEHGARPGDVDICAQRVSADGALMWNRGGPVAVASSRLREHSPVAVPDGAGGAIVAFLAEADGRDDVGPSGVAAQRIGPDGALMWRAGEQSVVVQEAHGRCADLAAAPDGAGGAYLAFRHAPPGEGEAATPRLMLQRLTAQGDLAWRLTRPTGLRVAPSARHPREMTLIPDGRDGVWVLYEHGSTARPAIAAQLIAPDGECRLGGNTVRIAQPADGPRPAGGFSAVSDNKGGFICVFPSREAGEIRKLHGIRITMKGGVAWSTSEAESLLPQATASCAEYALAPCAGHQAIIALTTPIHGGDGRRGLAAQKLSNLGRALWGGMPAEVTTPAEGTVLSPALLPDGHGGAYLAYVVRFTTGRWQGDTSIFGLRLGPNGKRLWREPVGLAAGPKPKRNPTLVAGP